MKRKALRLAKIDAKVMGIQQDAHYLKNCDNLANCSCAMCGNPRKWFNRKTLREELAEENYKEQMQELDIN